MDPIHEEETLVQESNPKQVAATELAREGVSYDQIAERLGITTTEVALYISHANHPTGLKAGSTPFDRITFDAKILGGRAAIRGMRIPVSVVVAKIAHGATVDEVLEDHPDLEESDVRQALEYAAWLTQEEVHLA